MAAETICAKIAEQIGQGVYPGASLALYDGQWQEYYLGTQDGSLPVRPGLTYDIASVSKVVGVGTLVTFLLRKGSLELDCPLAAYYPAFQGDAALTLRQLLTHTSGIDPYIPGRDSLDAAGLTAAVNQITVTADKHFKYTDVNFLLLGFMLETVCGRPLDQLFAEEIFRPFGMTETRFGPVAEAVPTVRDLPAGTVHDPKARVLGRHAGSAGLFSTLRDLEIFLNHYLADDFAANLTQVYGGDAHRQRSIAWDKRGDWLSHTGYTGTFIMYHRQKQKAAVFLSNRTFYKDDRPQWKRDRNALMDVIKQELEGEL